MSVVFVCVKRPSGTETVTVLGDTCKSYQTENKDDVEALKKALDGNIVVSFGHTFKTLQEHGIVSYYGLNLKDKFREKYKIPEKKKLSRWEMADIAGCGNEVKKFEDPTITKTYNGDTTCTVFKIIYENAFMDD